MDYARVTDCHRISCSTGLLGCGSFWDPREFVSRQPAVSKHSAWRRDAHAVSCDRASDLCSR
eukprot:8875022-Alexandrium_andersonii.AAC.1